MRILTTIAAAALLVGGVAGAQAAQTYSVSVWTGANDGVNSSNTADAGHQPTGLASAVFTYTGDINWYVPGGGTNPAGAFIAYGGGTISGFSSPRGTYANVAGFQAATLSTPGDTIDSYFQITGSYSAAAAIPNESITHDDGASLYVDGSAVFLSPGETSSRTETFTLPGGTHNFVLDYVEANGAPSVLNIVFPNDVRPIAEPASLGCLALVCSAWVARFAAAAPDAWFFWGVPPGQSAR